VLEQEIPEHPHGHVVLRIGGIGPFDRLAELPRLVDLGATLVQVAGVRDVPELRECTVHLVHVRPQQADRVDGFEHVRFGPGHRGRPRGQ
jgi:hypothetical protein